MTAPEQRTARGHRARGVLALLSAGALSLAALLLVRGPVTWGIYFAVTVTVFVWMVVLTYRRRPRLPPVAFALGWLCSPLVLLVAFWWTGDIGDYVMARTFDAEVWREKAGADLDDRTRLRMVDDLRSSGRLDRLTRQDAVLLLGQPLEDSRTTDALVWIVGRGSMIDLRFLRLRFGSDGRVVSHEIFDS